MLVYVLERRKQETVNCKYFLVSVVLNFPFLMERSVIFTEVYLGVFHKGFPPEGRFRMQGLARC